MTNLKYPRAVCCIIEKDGLYLAVSRRNDITQWGFPGGKVEEGESSIHAIQRELEEEIDSYFGSRKLEPIFVDKCEGDVEYWVTTYLFTGEFTSKIEYLYTEEGLTIAWKTQRELCSTFRSPFAKYNYKAFAALDKMCDNN